MFSRSFLSLNPNRDGLRRQLSTQGSRAQSIMKIKRPGDSALPCLPPTSSGSESPPAAPGSLIVQGMLDWTSPTRRATVGRIPRFRTIRDTSSRAVLSKAVLTSDVPGTSSRPFVLQSSRPGLRLTWCHHKKTCLQTKGCNRTHGQRLLQQRFQTPRKPLPKAIPFPCASQLIEL
eukprot:6990362-Pyramimonas_sp.AAC.3